MKAGQKSIRSGIEDILFPMSIANCSQGDNEGTHLGTFAMDSVGKDAGRDLAYFPFSAKCKYVDSSQNGNAVFWESLNTVRFANGIIDYATIMVIHDNDLSGIRVGIQYAQGIQMAQEGTAGYATGNHLHLEVARGKFTRPYDKNVYGVYHLPNNMPIESACFIDGTELIGICKQWPWKLISSVSPSFPNVKPPQWNAVREVGTFTPNQYVEVSNEPTQASHAVAYYNAGMAIHYDYYVKNDGYVWISYLSGNGTRRFVPCRNIATNIPLGTFK
ncbi:MAG: SH3 domain-containing protein [Longicatena sp.]